MRDVYAVLLPFDASVEGRAPLARALVRRWAAEWMGGSWPADTDPRSGTWSSATEDGRVALRWRELASGGARLREAVLDRPSRDRSVRWSEVAQVGTDGKRGFLYFRSSLRSASNRITGVVRYDHEPPALIASALARLEVKDASWPLRPEVVRDADGVDVAKFLSDPARSFPVFVADPEVWVPDSAVSDLAGLAHVVLVDSGALADSVGRDWSYPVQGGRLFWAGWSPGDAPARHQSFGPAELGPSDHGRQWWPLVRLLMSTSAFRVPDPGLAERLVASEASMRLAQVRALRASGPLSSDEVEELLDAWQADTDALSGARRALRRQAERVQELEAERDALLDLMSSPRGATSTVVTDRIDEIVSGSEEPADFGEVVEAAGRLPGLGVSPEALRSVEDCVYRHPAKVMAALRGLSDLAMRWRDDDLDGGFSAHTAEAGIPWRGGISFTAAERFPGDYRATWGGSEETCHEHLSFGANTSPTGHLRWYLHLDRDTRTVVLGPFGRHGRDASNR